VRIVPDVALILVVEADATSRRRILASLRALGHTAFGREDGRLALDLLSRRPGFDVVIARFTLPKMSGTDVLRAVAMTVPSASGVLIADERYAPPKHRRPDDQWITILPRALSMEDLELAVENALEIRRTHGREPVRS
jgi:DNA-binding NtrC family response regulator